MSDSHEYSKAFNQAYEALNNEQRKAVDAIEGPVMVIAGPGTGKTQILSVRIGNILQRTDALPSNILCLTYTEAGTIAMRKRLLSFVGPDAYQVQVQTFHAFCNEVIQSNSELFGKRDLDLISDLEKAVILENILIQLPPNHLLRRFKGDLSYDAGKLKDLFAKMKDEDWSPDFVEAAIDQYIADLPNRDTYVYKRASKKKGIEVGDVKQDLLKKEVDKMEKLRAAVRLYETYEQQMSEAGRYDYSDMILWVLNAFKSNTDLLRTYQERYQYVLVDEYQDTNGAQNEVLQLLIDFWDEPNLFVVGDDDQSIFEFQGARVKNILDVYTKYVDTIEVVLLTNNYRSIQQILDVSKSLIEHNSDRLVNHIKGLSKNLNSAGAQPSQVCLPELHSYDNLMQERVGILEQIKQSIGAGNPASEIAVIYHRHAQANELIELFERSGLPYAVRKQLNALDQPIIRHILTIMEYVSAEYQKPGSAEHLLFELLYFPYFSIHQSDILAIAAFIQSKRDIGWRQLISDPDLAKQVKLRDPEALQQLDKQLTSWIAETGNLTLPMLSEKVLNEGGILSYVIKHRDKLFLLESISSVFRFIQREAQKNPVIKVNELLELFEQLRVHKIAIPVVRNIGTEDGVQFITCHSAKGLEFNQVFLMGCTSNRWERARSGNFSFTYPDTLTFSNESNNLEALRRLFYVAMTRARNELYISYALADDEGKNLEPTALVAEADEVGLFMKIEKKPELSEVTDALITSLTTPKEVRAPLLEEAYLLSRVKHMSMSASNLNTYLECPVKFYFTRILNIPQAKNDSMEFGNAIHEALQRFFSKLKATGELPSSGELVYYFTSYMNLHKEAFTELQFKNRYEYGEKILPEYYDHYKSLWNRVVITEYPIRHVSMEGIPINGKLDKLEFQGSDVNVVDYKTGSIAYAKEKLKRPSDALPLGGDYWRQMVFYRILLDEQQLKNWHMVSGEFDFIEKNSKTGKFEKEIISISSEDVQIVRQQIKDAYTKITNLEFTQGCGKEDCYYCNLLKE